MYLKANVKFMSIFNISFTYMKNSDIWKMTRIGEKELQIL